MPARTKRRTSPTRRSSKPSRSKTGQVRISQINIVELPLWKIFPSPENDKLYEPVDPADPAIVAMAKSMAAQGVLEPLVVTKECFILSGHRRYAAAGVAGLQTVPCRVYPIYRYKDINRFVALLREFNRQRDKTNDEKLREELVSVDADEAYQALIQHREEQSQVQVPSLAMGNGKKRSRITEAKRPMLDAVLEFIESRRNLWPLSDRMIHYGLLNNPPLRHASKRRSTYRNDKVSYHDLTDLLTRARIEGFIPMEAIGDETRPVSIWNVHPDVRQFIASEFGGFLKGYYRDLMRTQPNQVEIIGEKNTVGSILRSVAARYRIPLTTGRGYCSLPPRHGMAERFRKSGKEKLVVLIVSDLDPDGEEIAASFARSMRDDFGVDEDRLHPIKVALTSEQVRHFNLPAGLKAKPTSKHFAKFVAKHGKYAYELEALTPEQLQQIVSDAIDSVLDVPAFNAQIDDERNDAAFLQGVRNHAKNQLTGVLGETGESAV